MSSTNCSHNVLHMTCLMMIMMMVSVLLMLFNHEFYQQQHCRLTICDASVLFLVKTP